MKQTNQYRPAVQRKNYGPKPQPATVGEYLDLVNQAPVSRLRTVAEQQIQRSSEAYEYPPLWWLPEAKEGVTHGRKH